MTGKQKIELYNSIIMVTVSILLKIFLIPKFGVTGAAISTVIVIILMNLITLLEIYFFYKIHPYDTGYYKGIVPAILSSLVIIAAGGYINAFSPLITLVLNTVLIATIFGLSTMVLGLTKDEKYLLNTFIDKVFRRGKMKYMQEPL
jgi:O-antigen/teichoic acid export membrane protein